MDDVVQFLEIQLDQQIRPQSLTAVARWSNPALAGSTGTRPTSATFAVTVTEESTAARRTRSGLVCEVRDDRIPAALGQRRIVDRRNRPAGAR